MYNMGLYLRNMDNNTISRKSINIKLSKEFVNDIKSLGCFCKRKEFLSFVLDEIKNNLKLIDIEELIESMEE